MSKVSFRFVWLCVLFAFTFNFVGAILNAWFHDVWAMAVSCSLCVLLLFGMNALLLAKEKRKMQQ